jgi:hypothetical protein
MNINHFHMWHSCSYLIMLQNSFLCDNATNFLTSQWYGHRLVITIWRTIAPRCDIHGYSDIRMCQTFPKRDKHFQTLYATLYQPVSQRRNSKIWFYTMSSVSKHCIMMNISLHCIVMNISQRRNVTTISQCHIVTNVSHHHNVTNISLLLSMSLGKIQIIV